MKVLILADANSSHTIKWAVSLAEKNIDIILFSLSKNQTALYNNYKNITIESAGIPATTQFGAEAHVSKLIYLKYISTVKKIIRDHKPDILHSHYATSYGLLGASTGFHPFIVSVWGTDIYNFPERNLLYKKIIQFILNRADRILSTSNKMALQAKKFTGKQVEVTPFGIDTERFKPQQANSIFSENDFVVGTIKTLERKYGIEYLIRAFSLVKKRLPHVSLKLLIAGSGTLENHLKKITKELDIEGDTIFTGYVIPAEVPNYINMLDIFVSLSIEESESFGVAVIEASACEKPVIVSNVGGLPEVIDHNKTGIVVEPKNIEKTADAIEKLVLDKQLRSTLGKNGRKKVIEKYNWGNNLDSMISIYNNVLNRIK